MILMAWVCGLALVDSEPVWSIDSWMALLSKIMNVVSVCSVLETRARRSYVPTNA